MKKLVVLLSILLLGATVACAVQAMPTVTVTLVPPTAVPSGTTLRPGGGSPDATVGALNFDAARAFSHNRALAVDIGKRVAGTEGGKAAADYLFKALESYGYQVTRQPFPFDAWEDQGTRVQVLTPTSRTFETLALMYSPGATVDGDLVLVPGLGYRDDYAKVNVRGKVALVQRGTIPFSDKAANGEQAGAAAVIIYNTSRDVFTGTLRDPVKIPVIALSGDGGQELLNLLRNGTVHVRVESRAEFSVKTGTNVIAVRRGTSEETIVVGGHYDSVAAGPGAVDNGSGTAVLLELARAAAQRQWSKTLVFAAFDAEELGLFGSRYYVDQLSDQELRNTRAMLNLDMLGGGSGPLLVMGDGNAALLGRSSAKELSIEAQNSQLPSGAGSDHESFARRGVDTVFFMRDYTLLHTPQDTIDQVQQKYLEEAGKVAERVLQRIEGAANP